MRKKFLQIMVVIIAGEAIFMLPFLIPRLLRPLMIESWEISNTTIGVAFSAYGLTALVSYFLGGPLADKFSPKKLISFSLVLTALGGILLLSNPSETLLITVYGYFGFSTTLLMWSALIKLTHSLGGPEKRAGAMGLLDSGRGLTAAIVSSSLVWLISYFANKSSLEQIKFVYLFVIVFTIIIALAVAFLVQDESRKATGTNNVSNWNIKKVKQVIKNKQVWLLGVIVLSSYCGYKNIDNYSIYFVNVLKKSTEDSSAYTSIIFWMRPLGAIICGFLVDRIYSKYHHSRFLILAILLLTTALSQYLLVLIDKPTSAFYIILSIIITSSLFTYALRAIYFAVFDDMKIPSNVLGTTIGIVSVIGFLPDFFFGTFTGYLIDTNPGITGFQQVFTFVSSMLFIGALASLWCWREVSKAS